MAKQSGFMPVEGSLGKYTFFKSKEGLMVRTRTGVSDERIATDPDFQRTRENNAEFGRAGKAAKVLRVSLRNSIIKAKDGRMVSRLSTQILKAVKQMPQVSAGSAMSLMAKQACWKVSTSI